MCVCGGACVDGCISISVGDDSVGDCVGVNVGDVGVCAGDSVCTCVDV